MSNSFMALYIKKSVTIFFLIVLVRIQSLSEKKYARLPETPRRTFLMLSTGKWTPPPHFPFTPCKQADKISSFIPKYCFWLQRPPSSSLSYGGPVNDDVRSPGTPGPLSQPPASQQSLDASDPGELNFFLYT